MTIDGRDKADIKSEVTSQSTTEGDFRDGVDNIIDQVDDNQVKLARVTDSDMDKLNDITATATEINSLAGYTAGVSGMNRVEKLDAIGNGDPNQVMTSEGNGDYKWEDAFSYSWNLSDGDTVVNIDDTEYIQIIDSDITARWDDTSEGDSETPFTLALSIADDAVTEDHILLGGSGHWSFNVDSDNNLNFQFNGVTVVRFSSTGKVIAEGDVEAFSGDI